MALAAIDADKQPSACLGCGECAKVCPQQIDIPGTMKKFSELLGK
jgi:predicted aldo/keto reductase-like oxidoreductase